MSEPVFSALDRLLEAEKQALIRGDLSGLLRFATRKERLVLRLRSTGAEPADLQRLEQKMRRNSELLLSASDGLRTAAERLRQCAAPAPLKTYTGAGQSQPLEPASGGVIRRA